MHSTSIPNSTRTLGEEQGYNALPIRDVLIDTSPDHAGIPAMVSWWQPTSDELTAIIWGAPISLTILGTGHPPVKLGVEAAQAIRPVDLSRASLDVLKERRRQVTEELWTAEHDDGHTRGEIARAAACYALAASGAPYNAEGFWPWAREWWKPGNVRRMLVKAAALIIAEIERIDRVVDRDAPEGKSHV